MLWFPYTTQHFVDKLCHGLYVPLKEIRKQTHCFRYARSSCIFGIDVKLSGDEVGTYDSEENIVLLHFTELANMVVTRIQSK